MRKMLLSLVMLAVVVSTVGGAFAAFTDTATANDNIFQAGTLDLELSQDGSTWDEITTNTWVSPTNWAPGDSFVETLWLRSAGTIDIATLNWDMSGYVQAPDNTQDLGTVVRLTGATYDGVDILPALTAAYAGGGTLTLRELHDGTPFDLESGSSLIIGLPKQLVLTWQFDPGAGNVFQGRSVTVDFDFNASNI